MNLRMKNLLLLFLLTCNVSAVQSDTGILTVASPHGVKDTLDRLEAVLEAKGMTVFARIDHAGGAKKAGLELADTELLIFGNPKVGTPFMHCARGVALDLPQKALAWEDGAGQVWLSYNDPAYLAERHGAGECAPVIQKISRALAGFVAAASSP